MDIRRKGGVEAMPSRDRPAAAAAAERAPSSSSAAFSFIMDKTQKAPREGGPHAEKCCLAGRISRCANANGVFDPGFLARLGREKGV